MVRGVEGEGRKLGATTLARLTASVQRNNESEFFRTTLGASLYTLKNFNTPTFRFSWKKYLSPNGARWFAALPGTLHVSAAGSRSCSAVPDTFERLKAALADRYAIEHELGSGGMATVYLAEDLKHHRKVAVKVLRSELAAALGPERFLREIEIAARLTHPHILPLHDSGEAQGFLYYGSVLGDERVELQPSAVIEGNIATPRLVVHEGAVVRGRIRMGTQNGAPSSHLEPRIVVGRSHATASR